MINSQQNVSGVSTIDAPAATTNGDNYVLAWATANQSLWWTTCPAVNNQTSYDWAKEANIPNASSSGGPALTNFKGTVWMAWKGEGTDPRIFLASLGGSTWSPGVQVSGIGTSSSPALTVTASELYLVWKGEHDSAIYWSKSSDGKAWSPQLPVPGAASSDTPALAGFKGVVYLAWKGESDNSIWLSNYTDADGWAKTATRLPSDYLTSHGPALGVGNTGNLHIVWKGAHDNFEYESVLNSGKTTWTPQAKIVGIATSARPALASQLSSATALLLAFKGATTTDLWVGPLDDLRKLYPAPPLTITDTLISWCAPSPYPPPPPPGPDAPDAVNFGWGPSQAAFAVNLVLSNDGKATFQGWYQDQGQIPIWNALPQNYHAAMVVVGSNKVGFTFSHSGNDIATGGAIDPWNTTQTNAAIANNWKYLQAAKAGGPVQAIAKCSCTNSSDLGQLLDSIVSDLEELLGWAEDAIEVISVVA